jgi:hypothetical protein
VAKSVGQKDMAERFHDALERANEHFEKVRSWLETLTLQSTALRSKAKSRKRTN